MKVLHITPHMGGGVGTVIMAWMEKVKDHTVICLDAVNGRARKRISLDNMMFYPENLARYISRADIVLVHYWDHPMLENLFSQPLPPCRLVFWCHKNFPVSDNVINFPDHYYNTSPVQSSALPYIWSTGNMDRFFDIKKTQHEGFNIGYVGWVDYRKLHDRFLYMCECVLDEIPDATITVLGEIKIPLPENLNPRIKFLGQIDDISPYLTTFDVFGYPLRPDHFGTSEQVLGEAMAAGVVPVVLNNMAERWIVMGNWDGVRAKSEDQYVRELVRLYKNPKLRGLLSKNVREVARNRYSIDGMVDKWENVFEGIMKEPKRERKSL